MQNKVIYDVDIYKYPFELKLKANTSKQSELTIGDLHGNAFKLIHFLIAENVLNLNEQNFNYLVNIYQKPTTDLTLRDIKDFEKIIFQSSFNQVGLLRFLGDELADRGQNDLFTLFIFKKMRLAGIHYEILFSNHGLAFLENYEQYYPFSLKFDLGHSQSSSWYNLKEIIGKFFSSQELVNFIENYYKPYLKILSYTITLKNHKPKLYVYSHAPIGIETIQALAKLYTISFEDKNIQALCNVINKINLKFKEDIQQNTLLRKEDFIGEKEVYFQLGTTFITPQTPLLRTVWNRAAKDIYLNTQILSNCYDIEFIHGHEGPQFGDGNIQSVMKNMVNLDATLLGKKEIHTGAYIVSIWQKD